MPRNLFLYTLDNKFFHIAFLKIKYIDFILKMCDNKNMDKIGILGGTFNPVHVEHVKLALSAVEELKLNKLFVIPTFIPPHKSETPAPATDRINMLKIAFKGYEKIEVSDFEVNNQGKSYTYLTVSHFKEQYKNAQIFFIVGGDMLADFKNWKLPEKILENCTLAVFGRQEFFADFEKEKEYFNKTFGKQFVKLSYQGKSASSTKIRVYTEFGLDINQLVPFGVSEYIAQKGLYLGDKYAEFIKRTLPPKRVKHTANVVITALSKAKALGLDKNKVKLTATLHDCAKYIDPKSVDGFILDQDIPAPVVHAFLGAFIAKNKLGVCDEEIIDAIRYHTSGKADMSALAKLIFVADMIEEDRDYEGVDKLRELFEKDDFEKCFVECLKEEFIHLINKKQKIYFETLNAFAFYVKS